MGYEEVRLLGLILLAVGFAIPRACVRAFVRSCERASDHAVC